MTDYTELKRLAEDAIQHSEKIGEHDWYHENEVRSLLLSSTEDAQFVSAARPEVVLALIAENERLGKMREVDAQTIARHQHQITSYVGDVTDLKIERDQLKAENEALRKALKAAEDAMWHADGNMDGEAADARDALAALSKGEQP